MINELEEFDNECILDEEWEEKYPLIKRYLRKEDTSKGSKYNYKEVNANEN